MSEAIDRKRLDRAREIAAAIVTRRGGAFALPIFERIEAEVEAAERRAEARARAESFGRRIRLRRAA